MQLHTISIPPALGEATLLEWLVAVGESVTPTTPLARVLTAHAEWVIPAQYVGIVAEHVVAAGATIPVGGELARCTPPPRARATPLARRLATALGVDLAALTGSGPGGRIMRADVVKAVDV
ncbi:MAG: E3 binding domain-containing protein, partial [Chloroflexus sp.]